jgi:hypothetical protein
MQLPCAGVDDVIGDLERLAKLRDSGVLTPAEFEAQKARLLSTAARPQQASEQCAGCGAPLQLDGAGRCIYCHHLHVAAAAVSVGGNSDAADDAIASANPGNKIGAIKELREVTGLGLKDAKDRIDAAYRRLGMKGS